MTTNEELKFDDKGRVSFGSVIEGANNLQSLGIDLLDFEGNNCLDQLVYVLLDLNFERFDSIVTKMRLDPTLTANVLASAKSLCNPDGSNYYDNALIYLQDIVLSTKQYLGHKTAHYLELSLQERKLLTAFLYRPPEYRQMPDYVKMSLLYPDITKQIPADSKNGNNNVLNIDTDGLYRVICCLLESDDLTPIPQDELNNLWRRVNWYSLIRPQSEKSNQPWGYGIELAEFNEPFAIEGIASDIRNLQGLGLNINAIIEKTKKVLPHRKQLSESDYFHNTTSRTDRYIKLAAILSGGTLL